MSQWACIIVVACLVRSALGSYNSGNLGGTDVFLVVFWVCLKKPHFQLFVFVSFGNLAENLVSEVSFVHFMRIVEEHANLEVVCLFFLFMRNVKEPAIFEADFLGNVEENTNSAAFC